MKTMIQSHPVQISTSVTGVRKLNDYLIRPLKSGFKGFTIVLMIIFFINLLSFLSGINESFGMDLMDLLLAGLGFALQTSSTLLKCFAK